MIRKAIPGIFTLSGLVAGCISIVYSLNGDLYIGGIMILIAGLFDFLDGMAARALDSISEFGKQLDSLADVVSFGVAPAMIMKQLMQYALTGNEPGSSFDMNSLAFEDTVLIYTPFLIAAFSALRLAAFNLDTEQQNNFKGLPTPANAMFFAGIGFMAEEEYGILTGIILFNEWILLAIIVLSCALLVSRFGMFSLKFKTFSFRENIIRYSFLLLSVILLVFIGLPALSMIVLMYIIFSILDNLVFR